MEIASEVSPIQPSEDFCDTFADCEAMLQKVVGMFCPPPAGIDKHELEQAATLGLWKATERYDESRSKNFEGFAMQCMRNGILDHIRYTRNAQRALYIDGLESNELETKLAPASYMNPESRLMSKEWLGEFAGRFHDLKPHLQDAFLAIGIGGMTLEEASNILGLKKNSVKDFLQRSRAELRKSVPDSPFVEY